MKYVQRPLALQLYGDDFEALDKILNCYINAQTIEDIEKCNALAAAVESTTVSLFEVKLTSQEKAEVGPLIAQALQITAQAQAQLKNSKQLVQQYQPDAEKYLK